MIPRECQMRTTCANFRYFYAIKQERLKNMAALPDSAQFRFRSISDLFRFLSAPCRIRSVYALRIFLPSVPPSSISTPFIFPSHLLRYLHSAPLFAFVQPCLRLALPPLSLASTTSFPFFCSAPSLPFSLTLFPPRSLISFVLAFVHSLSGLSGSLPCSFMPADSCCYVQSLIPFPPRPLFPRSLIPFPLSFSVPPSPRPYFVQIPLFSLAPPAYGTTVL